METNTTHKPIKIKAGRYNYRGVTIQKFPRTGFVAIVSHQYHNWHYTGLSTLAKAVASVDEYIEQGYLVKNGNLVHPLRYTSN